MRCLVAAARSAQPVQDAAWNSAAVHHLQSIAMSLPFYSSPALTLSISMCEFCCRSMPWKTRILMLAWIFEKLLGRSCPWQGRVLDVKMSLSTHRLCVTAFSTARRVVATTQVCVLVQILCKSQQRLQNHHSLS